MASTTGTTRKIERIVFMGTPQFAVPTLRRLVSGGRPPVLVVTQPDRPQGRRQVLSPPPVKTVAAELGLPVLQPENVNDPAAMEVLAGLRPDLVVTAAYGGFLGKTLRGLPAFGCLNLHPSLLPWYRGASPVPFTLFDNRTETGVTVFRMVREMDAGPILAVRRTPVEPDECATLLLDRLAAFGAELVLETVAGLEEDRLPDQPQDHSLATHTRKIGRDDLQLDWSLSPESLVGRIRGLAMEPGAVTGFRGIRLKVLGAVLWDTRSGLAPGIVAEVIRNRGILVATGGNDVLVTLVQPEGKRVMNAFEYHLGARIESGEALA